MQSIYWPLLVHDSPVSPAFYPSRCRDVTAPWYEEGIFQMLPASVGRDAPRASGTRSSGRKIS